MVEAKNNEFQHSQPLKIGDLVRRTSPVKDHNRRYYRGEPFNIVDIYGSLHIDPDGIGHYCDRLSLVEDTSSETIILNDSNLDELVTLALLMVNSGRRRMGSGNITHDGKFTMEGGESILVLRNPDGDKFANRMKADAVRIAQFEKVQLEMLEKITQLTTLLTEQVTWHKAMILETVADPLRQQCHEGFVFQLESALINI